MGAIFKTFKEKENVVILPAFIISTALTIVVIFGLIYFRDSIDFSPADNNAQPACSLDEININYPAYRTGEVVATSKPGTTSNSVFEYNQNSNFNDIKLEASGQESYLVTSTRLETVIRQDISDCEYQFGNEIDPYTEELISELKKNPNIINAQPNYILSLFQTADDPYYLDDYPDNVSNRDPKWNPSYDYQWNLKMVNADEAWALEGDNETIVAVIDTGVEINHPDLSENIWTNPNEVVNGIDDDQNGYVDDINGWNFITNTGDPSDDYGHGTAVSGVIAATTNNGIGIAGASQSVKIMPIKAFDSSGHGEDYAVLQALEYAVANGADVINASFGGSGQNLLFKNVLLRAYNKNIVTVASAGNNNSDVTDFYPANITCADDQNPTRDCVVTVGAVDEKDELASYSNFGTKLDVTAPGGSGDYNILSLKSTIFQSFLIPHVIGNNYVKISGTSFAAPHVSALAASIFSKDETLKTEEISNIILNGSEDLGDKGFDVRYGFGRIDMAKSLTDMNTVLPPQIRVINPSQDMVSGTEFWLTGSNIAQDFQSYDVELKKEGESTWSNDGVSVQEPNKQTRSGVLAKINLPSVNRTTKYEVRITVNTKSGQESSISRFTVNPAIAKNFPINLSNYNSESYTNYPLIADIDIDGKQEIILHNTNEHKLYAYDYEGKLKYGWPIWLIQDTDNPAPVVPIAIDMDPSTPGLEIFTLLKNGSGKLLGFHADGKETFNFRSESPINKSNLGWIDNTGSISGGKFGDQNVIVFSESASLDGNLRLHAIDSQGRELNGFPIALEKDAQTLPIIVENLDQNPDSEIVIQQNNILKVYSLTGEMLSIANLIQSESDSRITALTAGDINLDGKNEIIVAIREGGVTKINILDEKSTQVSESWPLIIQDSDKDLTAIQIINRSQNNSVEILASDSSKSYTIDIQGNILNTHEVGFTQNTSSINLDESTLFYSATNNSLSYMELSDNTSLLREYFSIEFPGALGFPSIYDLDGDKNSELIFSALDSNNNQYLYKFALNQAFTEYNWPLYLYNEKHTNAIETVVIAPTATTAMTPTPTIMPSVTPTEPLVPTLTVTPSVVVATPTGEPTPTLQGVAMRCISKVAFNPTRNQLITSVEPGQEFDYIIDFNSNSTIGGTLTDFLPESIEVMDFDPTLCSSSDSVLGLFSDRTNSQLNSFMVGIIGLVMILCTYYLISRHSPDKHHMRQLLVLIAFILAVLIIQIVFKQLDSEDTSPKESSAVTQENLVCELAPKTRSLKFSVRVKESADEAILNRATIISNGVSSSCENTLVIASPSPTPEVSGVECGPIDVNNDLSLTILDFAGVNTGFSKKYNQNCLDTDTIYEGCGGKDVNGDGKINITDFAGSIGFAKRYNSQDCRF